MISSMILSTIALVEWKQVEALQKDPRGLPAGDSSSVIVDYLSFTYLYKIDLSGLALSGDVA